MCYIVFISLSLHWRYIKIALHEYVIKIIMIWSLIQAIYLSKSIHLSNLRMGCKCRMWYVLFMLEAAKEYYCYTTRSGKDARCLKAVTGYLA